MAQFEEEGGQAGLGLCSDFRPNAGIFGLSDLPEKSDDRIQAEQMGVIQRVEQFLVPEFM